MDYLIIFFFKSFFFRTYSPFENLGTLICQIDISKTILSRGLKLGQLIGDDE